MEETSRRKLTNANVLAEDLLPTPKQVKEELPISQAAQNCVDGARIGLERILDGQDRRICLVVGPCSIHDLNAAEEYADMLRGLAQEVRDTFLIVMRVYFSKPRTTVGWKGLINDPHLDDSFRIDEGLKIARQFLLKLAKKGMPTGTEALNPIVPQYIDDLICWTAIGARTAESQTHREMASGLSTPVGFKNGTDGNINVAVNALKAVSEPHHFLGINGDGQCVVLRTTGNRYGHVVLRGGGGKPNYDSVSIALCAQALEKAQLPGNIFIDCSHGNSNKDHTIQPLVFQDCVQQIIDGNRSIVGLMLESNLNAGRQDMSAGLEGLAYGVSITDACIDWPTTEQLVLEARDKLKPALEGG